MSKENKRYWFVGNVAKPKHSFYLFQTDTVLSAIEHLKKIKGIGAVCRVSWEDLEKLTGAVKPDGCNKICSAYGNLKFGYKHCEVTVIS